MLMLQNSRQIVFRDPPSNLLNKGRERRQKQVPSRIRRGGGDETEKEGGVPERPMGRVFSEPGGFRFFLFDVAFSYLYRAEPRRYSIKAFVDRAYFLGNLSRGGSSLHELSGHTARTLHVRLCLTRLLHRCLLFVCYWEVEG